MTGSQSFGDGGAGYGIQPVFGMEKIRVIPPSNGVPTNADFYTNIFAIRGGNDLDVTATGSTQLDAYPISANYTIFTTVPAGAGAVLPNFNAQVLGFWGEVVNAGAHNLLLYPFGTMTINGSGAGAAIVIPAGTSGRIFINKPGQIFVR